MKTRRATLADLEKILQIHLECFPDDVITYLGPSFLRVFYRGYVEDHKSFCIVAEEEGSVAGFVVGDAHGRGGYLRLLREHPLEILKGILKVALTQWAVLVRVATAVADVFGRREAPCRAELVYIGVDPKLQGRGSGLRLATAFTDAVRTAGEPGCWAKTLADNIASTRMYRKARFELQSESHSGGRSYRIFLWTTSDSPERSEGEADRGSEKTGSETSISGGET